MDVTPGVLITQKEIDISLMIERQTPKRKANINLPQQQAILKAIDGAGGWDKLDPGVAESLRGMLDDDAIEMLTPPEQEEVENDAEAAA